MEKLIELICPVCDKRFEKRLTAYNFHIKKGRPKSHFFCSVDCRAKESTNSEHRNCVLCNKEFKCWKSSRQKFCCRPCYDKWQKLPRIKQECEWCGKIFPITENSTQRYCCKRCALSSTKETDIEKIMREELERRKISFEQYTKIGRFFVDFLLDNKVIIECDGIHWHTYPEVIERDKRKNNLLEEEGYKLFRFTDKQIKEDVKLCVDEI